MKAFAIPFILLGMVFLMPAKQAHASRPLPLPDGSGFCYLPINYYDSVTDQVYEMDKIVNCASTQTPNLNLDYDQCAIEYTNGTFEVVACSDKLEILQACADQPNCTIMPI